MLTVDQPAPKTPDIGLPTMPGSFTDPTTGIPALPRMPVVAPPAATLDHWLVELGKYLWAPYIDLWGWRAKAQVGAGALRTASDAVLQPDAGDRRARDENDKALEELEEQQRRNRAGGGG